MRWTPRAEHLLTDFLTQVPDDWRDRVRATARTAAATQARQIGNPMVDMDEVVMGYIQATPAELRPALRPVLEAAGVDVARYRQHLS
jgi:hypothetical protein